MSEVVASGIGDDFAMHAARLLDLPQERVQSAVDMLRTAVMRRVARQIAKPGGAASMLATLTDPRIDADAAATREWLLSDSLESATDEPSAGDRAAHALFGRRIGSIVLQVASANGLPVPLVGKLLGLLIPLIYAALGTIVRDRRLSARGLRRLLSSQEITPPITLRRSRGRRPASGGVVAKRAWHLRPVALAVAVLAAAAIGGGITIWTNNEETAGAVSSQATAADRIELPGGARLDVSPGDAIEGLVAFLSGNPAEKEYVLVLDDVRFEPGSATLLSSAYKELAAFAVVLTAFPEARVTIQVYAVGPAESGGDRYLEENRALAVRAALASLGVRALQISHAVPGESGGASGDRIEVHITRG